MRMQSLIAKFITALRLRMMMLCHSESFVWMNWSPSSSKDLAVKLVHLLLEKELALTAVEIDAYLILLLWTPSLTLIMKLSILLLQLIESVLHLNYRMRLLLRRSRHHDPITSLVTLRDSKLHLFAWIWAIFNWQRRVIGSLVRRLGSLMLKVVILAQSRGLISRCMLKPWAV